MDEIKKWIKKHQTNLLIMVVLVQLLVGLAGQFLRKRQEVDPSPLGEWVISEEHSLASFEKEEEEIEAGEVEWMVDIKGEVLRPGVYQVEPDMRVNDVIEMAGGVKEEANTTHINFAQQLEDQMMIYVPHQDEELTEEIAASSQESHLIDLNTADVSELQQLNGIGEKKALRIVQHRTVHGTFATIEELMEVSGIGQKTFDSLKDQITVSK